MRAYGNIAGHTWVSLDPEWPIITFAPGADGGPQHFFHFLSGPVSFVMWPNATTNKAQANRSRPGLARTVDDDRLEIPRVAQLQREGGIGVTRLVEVGA